MPEEHTMSDKTADKTAAEEEVATAETTTSNKTNSKGKNDAMTILKDIVAIVAFYLLFTTFAWGAFHIPSGSMEPTLEVGDRIFVSKFAYGYNRYSFHFDPEFVTENRLIESAPDRGDIVVFTLPYKNDTDFIKRVIGLPGDTVRMQQGRLFINDKIVPRRFIRDVHYTSYRGNDVRGKEYEETLPGGVKHRIYETTDSGAYDNTRRFKVPEGRYFMMGNNRDGSQDSRAKGQNPMGYIEQSWIIGKAFTTTFSLYDCDQGKNIECDGANAED